MPYLCIVMVPRLCSRSNQGMELAGGWRFVIVNEVGLL